MGGGSSRAKKKKSEELARQQQQNQNRNSQGQGNAQGYQNYGQANEYGYQQVDYLSDNTLREQFQNQPSSRKSINERTISQRNAVPNARRGQCPVPAETVANKIYFDEKELKRLRAKFTAVDSNKDGEITPEELGNLLELRSHSFRLRIIHLAEDKLSSEGKKQLKFDDFVLILSLFSYKCPLELKMKYLFRLYDINGDGFVDQKDLTTMLKLIFFVNENKEQGEVFETELTNEQFVEDIARDIFNNFGFKGEPKLDLNGFKMMLTDADVETRMNIGF